MTMFLTQEDIIELTGIRKGKEKKTRFELQIAALKKMKVPHFVNAAGRPVVARAVIEGGGQQTETRQPTWEPRLVGA
jgi:hypothetical protein